MSQEMYEQVCGEDWLAQLRELAAELEAGMHAVAANQLAVFERCVEKQLLLCHRLSSSAAVQKSPGLALGGPEAEVSRQIRMAAENLRTLNARYASLLRHSGRALRMFSALEESAERYLPAIPGAVLIQKARRPSWSCEG